MATDKTWKIPTWFLAATLVFSLITVFIMAMILRTRIKAHWPW